MFRNWPRARDTSTHGVRVRTDAVRGTFLSSAISPEVIAVEQRRHVPPTWGAVLMQHFDAPAHDDVEAVPRIALLYHHPLRGVLLGHECPRQVVQQGRVQALEHRQHPQSRRVNFGPLPVLRHAETALLLPHRAVMPGPRDQFLVGSGFDEFSAVHDENAVGARRGGKAVRDAHHRAPARNALDGPVYR